MESFREKLRRRKRTLSGELFAPDGVQQLAEALGASQVLADVLRDLWGLRDDVDISSDPRNQSIRASKLRSAWGQILTDDERARLFGLPAGCRMREGAKILSPENLSIGESCWIGENALLDASGGLTIGSHVSIGLSVFVWTHSSHLANLDLANSTGSDLISRRSTKIGSGCFIAGPSVILPGTELGDQVLVRPFSRVSGNVPNGSLVDGEVVTPGVFTREKIAALVARHRGQVSELGETGTASPDATD